MKNPSFVAFVKTLIATVAGAILVTAIVIFSAYMPFYTLLPAVGISAREEGEVRIHFLSVGEGDASIIEYPDGKCLLIDTGNGSFENDVHIYRYLKGLAPTALSVVLTHTDADHCGGMRSLFDKMEVEKLYLPVLGSGSSFYQRILKTAAEKGIPTEILSRYDVISHPSGAYAVCISPYSFGETDDNDASTGRMTYSLRRISPRRANGASYGNMSLTGPSSTPRDIPCGWRRRISSRLPTTAPRVLPATIGSAFSPRRRRSSRAERATIPIHRSMQWTAFRTTPTRWEMSSPVFRGTNGS